MILLSSHLDRVIQDYNLEYKNGTHKGLLDNFIGILTTYLALYDDQNLIELEKEGKIMIWHGKGEEWGLLNNAPKLTKKDLVIVVDVADGPAYKDKDFSLENISGIPDKKIKELKESLEWEGFKIKIKKYTGEPNDEDEAWKWREKGIPVISFIIPINAGKDYKWHSIKQDNTVSSDKINICKQGLKRLICYTI